VRAGGDEGCQRRLGLLQTRASANASDRSDAFEKLAKGTERIDAFGIFAKTTESFTLSNGFWLRVRGMASLSVEVGLEPLGLSRRNSGATCPLVLDILSDTRRYPSLATPPGASRFLTNTAERSVPLDKTSSASERSDTFAEALRRRRRFSSKLIAWHYSAHTARTEVPNSTLLNKSSLKHLDILSHS